MPFLRALEIMIYKQEDNTMGLFEKKDKKPAANLSSKSRLDIDVKKDGTEYTFLLEGRLDTITASQSYLIQILHLN